MKANTGIIGKDISKAAQLLREGGLVGIPTETVYGLAANAFSAEASLGIFEAKRRPAFDPLIVHTHSLQAAATFLLDIPVAAQQLAEAFWPGPLTLLLPRNAKIPDLVTSGLPTVAVRIPRHELTLSLLQELDFPLAAPSANLFGYISPTNAQHVADQLGERIDYILDGGPCVVGVESTIIGFEAGETVVYRLGGMALETLEQMIPGKLRLMPYSSSNPKAPGQLKSHYAPRIPLLLGNLRELILQHQDKKVAILSFRDNYPGLPQFTLSSVGDVHEAAQNLFRAMRELEKEAVDLILAEPVPDYGLGRAVNDRLRRAAARE